MLRPGADRYEARAALGVSLFDAFTGANQLLGVVEVSADGSDERPLEKPPAALFVFRRLPPGRYTLQAQSAEATPYYQAKKLLVDVPPGEPRRPTFPDLALADPDRLLTDPLQPDAYRTHRTEASLLPTVAYPFPADATLIRGTVWAAAGRPAAGQVVIADRPNFAGDDLTGTSYLTGPDGGYVLFFRNVSSAGEAVELRTGSAAALTVPLRRGLTALNDFTL